MAEYTAKDASGTTKYFKAQNTGASGDGFEQDVNVTDRAARDLGKVDIAAFDAALPAGTNNIGDVDIASALPAGSNTIGAVDITDKPARDLGKVDIAAFDVALPAGTNNIGDVDVLTGATDDAAAAGQIFPAAGLYQASGSVDEVDSGDVGRLRMSARRGLVAVPDYRKLYGRGSTVANVGDLEVSTTAIASGYAAPTTAFFDGTDPGFDAFARYLRIPMAHWKQASIVVYNLLGVSIDITLDMQLYDGQISYQTVDTVTATSAQLMMFGPEAGGSAASGLYRSVPALKIPCEFVIITIDPASDPSSGDLRVYVNRS